MVLTKSEMEIMDVLWGADKPLSRSDILDCSANKSWKDSSVHILLNGLLKKGIIQEVGFVKRSKTYGRIFAPSMSREEYFAESIYSYRYKPDTFRLLQAILKRNDLGRRELEQISESVNNQLNDL